MENIPTQGSIWRKWDLHLHTPSSYDYHNKAITNQQIIDTLLKNEIEVVAITDHHIIDTERINELKKLSNNQITIFPGIELRTDLGGKKSIHITGIFPENSDIDYLWQKISNALNITTKEVSEKGNEVIYVEFRKASELIRQNNGLVAIHAGNKASSIEEISNSILYKQELKKDLAYEYTDIFEINSLNDEKSHKEKIFKKIGFRKPMVIGSDNHNIEKYEFIPITWIKADPTFKGLQQAIKEMDNRIVLGRRPEVLIRFDQDPEKFITSLEISTKQGKKTDCGWFSGIPEILFNKELVAIIGNKGHGKSALADFIGIAGRSKNQKEFSFLNKRRFLALQEHDYFQVKIRFGDGSTVLESNLANRIENEIEKVTYLPQSYIESLCADVASSFEKKIKDLIFSYMPETNTLGTSGYDDYVSRKSETIQPLELRKKKEIKKNIEELLKLEKKLLPSHKEMVRNSIKDYETQLELISEPDMVPNPDINPEEKEKKTTILAKIGIYKSRQETVEQKAIVLQNEIKSANLQKHQLENLIKDCEELQFNITQITDKYMGLTAQLGLDIRSILSLTFDKEALQNQIDKCKNGIANAGTKSDKAKRIVKNIQKKIAALSESISTRQKEYLNYVTDLETYNKKKVELSEAKKKHEKELQYINSKLKEDIKKSINTLKGLSLDLFDILQEKIKIEEGCFTYVDQRIKTWQTKIPNISDHSLNFSASVISSNNCINIIQDQYLNAGVKGSFYGKEEANNRLNEIFNPGQKVDIDKLEIIIDDLIRALFKDTRSPQENEIEDIASQFRITNGKSTQYRFYEYLFGIEFLDSLTEIKSNNVSINELSPGEKGTVLLVIYLLLDKSTNPLVIDQPEENLDNQSVYQILRPFILEAKKRRQIIIVTHNPNIAVACDAEQLIYVHIDKSNNNQFSFKAGSIENPVMNKHVTDILEGTLNAFNNRKGKYMDNE